jgi:SPP1 family predicted phage head-tail adaptor
MDIGKLNKRITIQKYTTTVNENGFEVEAWVDYKPIWASRDDLQGREYYAAAAVQSENTVKFGIRYIKELDQDISEEAIEVTKLFRIKYINSTFDIKSIAKIGKNQFMKINALR